MNILEEIQNCPVEWKELGEVTDTVTSPVKLTKKEYQVSGEIPIVDQGEQFIAGFSDYGKYLKKDEYIIFGDHSEHVKYIDFAFVQGADGLKILKPKSGIKAKYIYYCFCNFYKKEGNYKRHWSKARTTLIPIPQSEEIQEKIVQTLDKFTDYVTELTSELTSRKKQYSFYRDKLLSFDDEVYQVEWKMLGDIGKVSMCKRILKNQTSDDGEIPFYKIGTFGKVATSFISRELFEEYKLRFSYPKLGDILISASGTIGRTVVFNGEDSYFQDSNIVWLEHDESQVLNRYLYYFYQMNPWKVSDGGTISRLYNGNIEKTTIPVPSLEIQSRIVQVLDNFDMVCNDLNIGLPKEIELRQKQYEYFREKLLTFVAEGEYTDSTVQYSTVQTRHH